MRYCLAWNLKHTQGLTYAKAAKILGVTTERARQLALKYERRCNRILRNEELQDRQYSIAPLLAGEIEQLSGLITQC